MTRPEEKPPPSTSEVPSPRHRTVPKPWGREEWLVVGERIVMKKLFITAGYRLSLQYHEFKEEAWLVIAGRARLRRGETLAEAGPGRVVYLPPRTIHRIEAIEDLEILEVSTPELDDVVRLEDDFGRQDDAAP